jgi:outer membrane receptor for ferrienterochelin and colicin
VHPTDGSTIRAMIGTAFRTPTFLEAYTGLPIPLPVSGGALLSAGSHPDQPGFQLKPEQVLDTEVGYLNSDSDYFTFDSAFFYNHVNNLIDIAPTRAVTVGDLGNPNVPTYTSSASAYNLFLGGFENQCQQYNVLGAELGVRTFPADGLDVYANTTLMDVKQDNSGCSQEQLNLIANDARTSAVKLNAGVELRTKFGISGSVDFHYVSPQDWAEQIVDIQKQQIVYQTFHLNDYELLNMSVGYRFLRQKAEIRGVAFNLLNDQHREHPFGQVVGRRVMALFSYRF